jgi:hypothetical protein
MGKDVKNPGKKCINWGKVKAEMVHEEYSMFHRIVGGGCRPKYRHVSSLLLKEM